ncbi:hypothetical protein BASA81_015422 [Batrachochytrium salamandrivorans]|nr:hypothetical protein BASA81_015422 [Batrachochytrium salamandrivorans]
MLAPTVQCSAYARVGILGNPSDGYGGRGLSSTIHNYSATAVLVPSPSQLMVGSLLLVPDLNQVEAYVRKNGYPNPVEGGDGTNLLLATIVVFVQAAVLLPPTPHELSLQVSTTVPRQVGLAGSSAICTAVFRALMTWSGATFSPSVVAHHVFLAESRELGIACGMQDRVAQAFDCAVEMDFALNKYTSVEPVLVHQHWFLLFPPAQTACLVKTSGGVHLPIKQRWLDGDAEVISKMQSIAALVPLGTKCLADKDWHGLASLMNQNFDLRLDLFGLGGVAEQDWKVIQLARSFSHQNPQVGVGCKLPGSGGCVLALLVDCTNPQAFVDYLEREGGVKVERIKPPPQQ